MPFITKPTPETTPTTQHSCKRSRGDNFNKKQPQFVMNVNAFHHKNHPSQTVGFMMMEVIFGKRNCPFWKTLHVCFAMILHQKKRVWFCDECHQHPSQNLPGFFFTKKQIGFCDECHQHPSQKLPRLKKNGFGFVMDIRHKNYLVFFFFKGSVLWWMPSASVTKTTC